MSLNWKEINLVLSELSLAATLVDKIVQRDFRNLYLKLHRPQQSFWLRITLESGALSLHRTRRSPEKPKKPLRFQEYLNAQIRGGRISSALQLGSDRIIRLRILKDGAIFLLWIKLWQGSENIIVSTEDLVILEAAFRRPAQSIVKGAPLVLPEPSTPPPLEIRAYTGDFSEYIEQYYERRRHETQRNAAKARMRQEINKRRSAYRRAIEKLRRELESSHRVDRYTRMGQLLVAALPRIRAHQSWFVTEDPLTGDEIKIELKPSESALQNAQRYFERAKKLKAKQISLSKRLKELEDEYAVFETASEEEQYARVSEAPKKDVQEKHRTGLVYLSHGYRIIVGRNARENDKILRHQVRGNDFWLHVRDFPGSHVFIRRIKKNLDPPPDVFVDAGILAVHYSKGKKESTADVYVAEVKNLRRAKHGVLGTVIPTRNRNLCVRVDKQRLSSLLEKC